MPMTPPEFAMPRIQENMKFQDLQAFMRAKEAEYWMTSKDHDEVGASAEKSILNVVNGCQAKIEEHKKKKEILWEKFALACVELARSRIQKPTAPVSKGNRPLMKVLSKLGQW